MSSRQGAVRDDTKNGWVADYPTRGGWVNFWTTARLHGILKLSVTLSRFIQTLQSLPLVYQNQQFQMWYLVNIKRLNRPKFSSWIFFHPQAIMSSYGVPTLVNVPRLNEMNAIQGIVSLLQHVDKGELKDLLENEEQLNVIISDNDEVSFSVLAFFLLWHC